MAPATTPTHRVAELVACLIFISISCLTQLAPIAAADELSLGGLGSAVSLLVVLSQVVDSNQPPCKKYGWVWDLFYLVMCIDYCVRYLWKWELAKTCTILYLVVFLLLFLILAGAWLGFWVVRKLILTGDGSIDVGVSNFVAWSIWIFGAAVALQSSVDPLLAAVNLICGILISFILRNMSLQRKVESQQRRTQNPNLSPIEDPYSEPKYSDYACPQSGTFTAKPYSNRSPTLTESEPFYSAFHSTPERRKFSKEEWEKFTRESTKNAPEGLVSSPDFSKWAVSHADRITLLPKKDSVERPRRWLFWS